MPDNQTKSEDQIQLQFLRLPSVKQRTSKSRTKIYDEIKRGLFVRPVKMGFIYAWPSHEVEKINWAYLAGKTESEIRVLIEELHRARTAASQ